MLYTIPDRAGTWAYNGADTIAPVSQHPNYMDNALSAGILGAQKSLVIDEEPSSPESSASSNSWDNLQSDCSSPDENEEPILDVSAPDFAFAFDIDGVLLKGGLVIPEAILALKVLNEARIPYIFVTNVSSYLSIPPVKIRKLTHTPGWGKNRSRALCRPHQAT